MSAKKGRTYDFHLKGGTVVRLEGVSYINLTSARETTAFTSYKMEFAKGYERFISFNVNEIAAVVEVAQTGETK